MDIYSKYIQILYLNQLADEAFNKQFAYGQSLINSKISKVSQLNDKKTSLLSKKIKMEHIDIIDSKLISLKETIEKNEGKVNQLNINITDIISSCEYYLNRVSLGNNIAFEDNKVWKEMLKLSTQIENNDNKEVNKINEICFNIQKLMNMKAEKIKKQEQIINKERQSELNVVNDKLRLIKEKLSKENQVIDSILFN